MHSRARALLIPILVAGFWLVGGTPTWADDCPTQPTQPSDWCHPPPTPAPTPQPTPAPTPAPTAAPTQAPTAAPTQAPTRRSTPQPRATPAPTGADDDFETPDPMATPFELDIEPLGTPEIVVQGPVFDDTDTDDTSQELNVQEAGEHREGGAGWAWFILGLIFGFVIRSAMPLIRGDKRRRKQQIFG